MQKNINYRIIQEDSIDLVKTLWEGLRDHHASKSSYFKEKYLEMTFEKRKANLFEKTQNGKLMIEIAEDTAKHQPIAYCISSINEEFGMIFGEIDSLYIDPDYRKMGIGNNLMINALKWLDSEKVQEKKIMVCEGNEEAFRFYKKFGFFHIHNILHQKDVN